MMNQYSFRLHASLRPLLLFGTGQYQQQNRLSLQEPVNCIVFIIILDFQFGFNASIQTLFYGYNFKMVFKNILLFITKFALCLFHTMITVESSKFVESQIWSELCVF